MKFIPYILLFLCCSCSASQNYSLQQFEAISGELKDFALTQGEHPSLREELIIPIKLFENAENGYPYAYNPVHERRLYRSQNSLIDSLRLDDATSLEYYALTSERPPQASIARLLDILYTKNWQQILADINQLRLYLKKSALFSRLNYYNGFIGKYRQRFLKSSRETIQHLRELQAAERDQDIVHEIDSLFYTLSPEPRHSLDDFFARIDQVSQYDLKHFRLNHDSNTYAQIVEAIAKEKKVERVELMLKLLQDNLSVEMVPPLFQIIDDKRVVRTEFRWGYWSVHDDSITVEDEVVGMLQQIYRVGLTHPNDPQSRALRGFFPDRSAAYNSHWTPIWKNRWRERSATYRNWEEELYRTNIEALKNNPIITEDLLNSVARSRFFDRDGRSTWLHALPKVLDWNGNVGQATDTSYLKSSNGAIDTIYPGVFVGDFRSDLLPITLQPDELRYLMENCSNPLYLLGFLLGTGQPISSTIHVELLSRIIDQLPPDKVGEIILNKLLYEDLYDWYREDSTLQELLSYEKILSLLNNYRNVVEQRAAINTAWCSNLGLSRSSAAICLVESLRGGGGLREAAQHVFLNSDSICWEKTLESIFGKIEYDDLEGILELVVGDDFPYQSLMEKPLHSLAIPYNLSGANESESLSILQHRIQTLTPFEVYLSYVKAYDSTIVKKDGTLDYQRIYEILTHDYGVGFIENYYDYRVESIVKMLEYHFGTNLGFINSNRFLTSTEQVALADRIPAWKRFLEEKNLAKPIEGSLF